MSLGSGIAVASVCALIASVTPAQAWFWDTWGCDTDAYRSATLQILKARGLYPIDATDCALALASGCDLSATVVAAQSQAVAIRAFAETAEDPCARWGYRQWAHYVEMMADRASTEATALQRSQIVTGKPGRAP